MLIRSLIGGSKMFSFKGFYLLSFASLFALASCIDGFAQQSGGGRAEPEPVRTESRVRRVTKPAVKRTAPKRTVTTAKTAETLEAEADKLFDSGDHDSALAVYQSAVKVKPLLKSLYRIGWIHNEFEQYSEALIALNRAAAIGPNEAVVFLEKGYAHRRLKQNNEALAALKKSVTLDPKSYIATYELGALHNDLGQYRDAVTSLSQSVANRSDYSESYEELGFAQRKLGLNNEAIISFRNSIRIDATNSGAFMGLGDAFFYGTKNYNEALDPYLKGLEYAPENQIAAYNVAWIYNENKNYTEALRWANRAIKIKPDYYQAYSEIGYANTKLGRTDAAMAAYQTALRYKPDDANSHFGIGDIYFDNVKNYPLALASYTKGLSYSPKNQTALYRSGWCYNNQKRYQEAITILQSLITINNKPAHYHREIGFSYWQLNRVAEAMTSLNRAVQLNPDEAASHYYLGLIYVGQRNREAAMRCYRELARLNYANAPTLLDRINAMR